MFSPRAWHSSDTGMSTQEVSLKAYSRSGPLCRGHGNTNVESGQLHEHAREQLLHLEFTPRLTAAQFLCPDKPSERQHGARRVTLVVLRPSFAWF